MVHDTPSLFKDNKTLDDQTKFRISGLTSLLGISGFMASSFLDNKSLRYPFIYLSLSVVSCGVFGMCNIIDYNTKVEFCYRLGRPFM